MTVSGSYIGCAHALEGDALPDQPKMDSVVTDVEMFVDINDWFPILSTLYDGSRSFDVSGNVSELANFVLEEREVTIVIEFINYDMIRSLRIQLLTVQNFELSSVLVSAEEEL